MCRLLKKNKNQRITDVSWQRDSSDEQWGQGIDGEYKKGTIKAHHPGGEMK
jgi:hypothetical protein